MAIEIERRFLVQHDDWRGQVAGQFYRQGYISVAKERTVRVRIVNETSWITFKSAISNESRYEFEYEIPVADANIMLDTMCPFVVEKWRYPIPYQGYLWEVDEFLGENTGLVLAEIELPDEQASFEKPRWVGQEVTTDGRFTNAFLSEHPYQSWITG